MAPRRIETLVDFDSRETMEATEVGSRVAPVAAVRVDTGEASRVRVAATSRAREDGIKLPDIVIRCDVGCLDVSILSASVVASLR
jgi:hypothetical protein